MDKGQFWHIIDNARREAGHWKDMNAPLQDALFKLDAPDILRWQRILEEYMNLSFKERLWAAAEVINGPCYEKDFENFQRWLIVQGEKPFKNALDNPESLARLEAVKELGRASLASGNVPPKRTASFEALEFAAVNAYESKPREGDFYDALDDCELTYLQRADISQEIIFAKDIDIDPSGPDMPWLETTIARRQAFPELYALFNDVTAASIQNYDIINSTRLGGGSVMLMENKLALEPYLVCDRSRCNPLGIDEFTNILAGDDYLAVMRVYADRVSERVTALEQERESRGVDFEKLTAADCVPDGMNGDLEGKAVVIKLEELAPEYRSADYQLVLVTGGFGAKKDAHSGRKVYCTDIFTGKSETFRRSNIAGVILPERMPDWAREKLAALRKPKERESVLDKIRESKKTVPARDPKDNTHRKTGPER
jgi:hypothetical protein